MLIQVNYSDNRFDYVKDNMLGSLISAEGITRFRRTSGWATIGVDPLRKSLRNTDFKQPDNSGTLVRVEYNDHRFDYVRDNVLDLLIDADKVAKFQRKSGWVTVGIDPLRKTSRR